MLFHSIQGAGGFTTAGSSATITYVNNFTNTSGLITYTFTVSGSQTAGLYVIGVIAENINNSTRTLSSGTFDGNAMTSVVNTKIVTGASGSLIGALFQYKLTSTASGPSVGITFSGAMSRANIGVWRIDSNTSDIVFDTDTSSISGSATDRTNTLVGLGSGYVGVAILANAGNATTSWTNATERYEAFASGTGGSGADFTTTSSGNRTITATSTSGSNDGLILVSGAWA